jgi:hypothetical protein
MLKNKKAIYLLIPLNVFIWGYFVYRFYAAFTDGDLPPATPPVQVARVSVLKDSLLYKLDLRYKDPFLKEQKGERAAPSTYHPSGSAQKPAQPARPPKVPEPLPVQKQVPEIRYLGLIRNTSSGVATALISVNGQSRLIRQNETVDGIVFKSFNHDSLVARWGKERIVARK